jgi:hypothetical protein
LRQEVETLAKRELAPGGHVVSDGLSCWPAVKAGCGPFLMVTPAPAARWAPSRPRALAPPTTSAASPRLRTAPASPAAFIGGTSSTARSSGSPGLPCLHVAPLPVLTADA